MSATSSPANDYDDRDEKLSSNYRHKLDDELNQTARLWIRHALTICQARVLRVCLQARRRLCLDNAHLASQRLTTVELTDATFEDSDSCID